MTSDAALLERYRDAGRKEVGDISTPASACTSRAVVTWAATALTSPEASINANTLKPSATAESAGKATHTVVQTPAMISVRCPVARTAAGKAGASHNSSNRLLPCTTG